jgi:Flp pilus assembly protein TadG
MFVVRRRLAGEHGFTTVQFTMVFPVLLFAIVAAVQGASYFHMQRVVQAAAEDGAAAARAANGNADLGRAVALDTLSQLGGAAVGQVTVTASRNSEEATVEVVGRAVGPLGTVTVRSVSSGPAERFRPEQGAAP